MSVPRSRPGIWPPRRARLYPGGSSVASSRAALRVQRSRSCRTERRSVEPLKVSGALVCDVRATGDSQLRRRPRRFTGAEHQLASLTIATQPGQPQCQRASLTDPLSPRPISVEPVRQSGLEAITGNRGPTIARPAGKDDRNVARPLGSFRATIAHHASNRPRLGVIGSTPDLRQQWVAARRAHRRATSSGRGRRGRAPPQGRSLRARPFAAAEPRASTRSARHTASTHRRGGR